MPQCIAKYLFYINTYILLYIVYFPYRFLIYVYSNLYICFLI